MSTWIWPLKAETLVFPDDVCSFGAVRTHDVHTGVDLFCELGQEIVAVEDGVVIHIEGFTGPNADDPSPWWNDTDAILVKGATGVVTYGEVKSLVKVGERVKQGQVIAVVEAPVLRSFKGRPMVMLHLELMAPEATRTWWWKTDGEGNALPMPSDLRDPTSYLKEAAGNLFVDFRLEDYDGQAFRDPSAKSKPAKWWAVWGGSCPAQEPA